MTAIVGIRCQDGIVLGTDSSATFSAGSFRTIEQPTDHKLQIIADRVLVAGTGQIGLGQRFAAILKSAYSEKIFQKPAVDAAVEITRATIKNFASTEVARGQYGALVAFPVGNKPHLCEFAIADLQPELKDDHLWYCSMGSAQPITDPFLGFIRRVFWKDGPPTVSEGVFATLWTLQQAIELNPGGVGGDAIVGVLANGKDGKMAARLLTADELSEQMDAIDAAEKHLETFRTESQADSGPDLPEAPSTD